MLVNPIGVTPARAENECRVKWDASGGFYDGTTWATAYPDLQSALGSSPCTEIWVAAGTYTPGSAPTNTFQLKDGVAIYGGFIGTETARSERNPDPATNGAILSGEIGNTAVITDNSYHVIKGATGAILDGFTITAGYANGSGTNAYGGGMYNENSSPALTNIIFSANSAKTTAGGMYNLNSSPALTNITFSENTATYGTTSFGGGMYNENSSPALTDVTFSKNRAIKGGGVYNYFSDPTLTNVTFSENRAIIKNDSGAVGGGMYNRGSSPTLTNVTFSANSARIGGGMYNDGGNPTLTNVTFSANSGSTLGGGGMLNANSSSATVKNSIFWGNTGEGTPSEQQIYNASGDAAVSDSIVQGGYAGGTHILSADPKLGPLGDYGGFTHTTPLLPGSPALDAGNNTVCTAAGGSPNYGAGGLDQRGFVRPQGASCDIGAFESGGFTLAVTSGDNQATPPETEFPLPLVLTVTANSANEPVVGGEITFTSPGSGASTNPAIFSAIISADGTASSATVTANGVLGGPYLVTASASGAESVTFSLTNKTLPVITWADPASIVYGDALSITQLNATADVPGAFVYTPAIGAVLTAGTHTLHVAFTPTDTTNYSNASKAVTVTIAATLRPLPPCAFDS